MIFSFKWRFVLFWWSFLFSLISTSQECVCYNALRSLHCNVPFVGYCWGQAIFETKRGWCGVWLISGALTLSSVLSISVDGELLFLHKMLEWKNQISGIFVIVKGDIEEMNTVVGRRMKIIDFFYTLLCHWMKYIYF